MDIIERLDFWIDHLERDTPCTRAASTPVSQCYLDWVELAWRLLGPAKEADVEHQYVEWRVDKTTTERLSHILNELADMGRVVALTQFVGGRDWVVLSTRALEGAKS